MHDANKPILITPTAGEHGMTDLHYAAYSGDLSELIRCLEPGAEVNAVDDGGYSAAHWLTDMAANGGPRLEMLEVLVKYGANLNLKAGNGCTALDLAHSAGSDLGDELASKLLQFGAKKG